MNHPHNTKLNLIEMIVGINNESVLQSIENEVSKILENAESNPNPFEGVRPIRENVSLNQIMKEQHYQPITFDSWRELTAKLEFEDSIEDLLKELSA
jgi:hypothetical protein